MPAGPSSRLSSDTFSPVWIGLGLTIVILGAFYPNAPVVTAIALISLGATEALVSRGHWPPSAVSLILLHSISYTLLYALFIGARLYTPAGTSAAPLTLLTSLDLVASTLPMAVALRRILACLRTATLSRP
jgi:hypothetical protein